MQHIYHEIYQSLRAGRTLVMASVIADRGSTPRGAGSRMVIYADGSIAGTIGGGAVEADIIKQALPLFERGGAHLLSYDLNSTGLGEGMDLICGGHIQVLLEVVAVSKQSLAVYEALIDELTRAKPVFLVAGVKQGANTCHVDRALYTSSRKWCGSLPHNHELELRLEQEEILHRTTSLIEVDDITYVIEKIEPPETIYLVGGGHVAKEIAVLADMVEFQTVVFDDRAEFANRERFATAAEVRTAPGFHDVFGDYPVHQTSYIIIVTRGHRYDREVLAQALRTEAGYIGMIGSRRKRDNIYQSLIDEGFGPGDLEKVCCPIGLSIQADTPAEIAVSVVAQLIRHRAERKTNG